MKNIKILSLFTLFLFTSSSFAGVLVEPFLGYGFGSGEVVSSGVTVKDKTSGPQYGARVGYSFLGLMGGLEYRKVSGSMKFDSDSRGVTHPGAEQDFSGTEIGAFIGYNLPILVRAYVGYTFNTEWEFDNAGWRGSPKDEMTGNTTTLGVGFTGLPFVSLNLEFRMIKLDKFKDASTGLESTIDYSSNEVMVGISLPLDF